MGAQRSAHFGRTEACPLWAQHPKMNAQRLRIGAQMHLYQSHDYKIGAHKRNMDAQRPAHFGRTEACPLWAHRCLPTMGAQMPAHFGRTEASRPWAHRGRPTMGAQKPVHFGRTCPPWAHRGASMSAQRPAHLGRTEGCTQWTHRGLQWPHRGSEWVHKRFEIDHMITKLAGASTK